MLGLQFKLVGALCVLFSSGVVPVQRVAPGQSYTTHVRELTRPERAVVHPLTGSETVLDVLASVLPRPGLAAPMDMWLVRRGDGGREQVLPIDWLGIGQRGETRTNYQILAGDRLFLQVRIAR